MFSLLFFTNFMAIWQNSFSTKIFYEFLFYFLTSLCCRREILGIVCQTCFPSKIFTSHIQTFYHAKGAFYKEDGNPTEWKQWKWPLGSEYSTHNKIPTCENTWQRATERMFASDLILFQLWVAYAPCGSQHKDAVQITLEQIDLIKRLVDLYPDYLQLVHTSQGIICAAAK